MQSQAESQLGVTCRFQWPIIDNEFEVVWEKTARIPFMPRKGDRFQIDGCSSLVVLSSEYSVDYGIAEVRFCAWPRCKESWGDIKKSYESLGWQMHDHGQELPPCFDDVKTS